jgi:hypothetical protein
VSLDLALEQRVTDSADHGAVAVFGLTLAAGAVLMFLLEPMAAKMVLPSLGGAPAVWNTCVVFFQFMLLGGYAYAHAGPKWLGVERHALIHSVLLLAAVLTLLTPFQLNQPHGATNPVAWLLLVLLESIGLPFFLLATSAPLLQVWFSRTRHRAAKDPYFLYAASNFGSLAGLLMYPLAVEPFLPLRLQARYWTYGYMAYVVLVAACAVRLLRTRAKLVEAETAAAEDPISQRVGPVPSLVQRFRWIALSFAPSSLMLAVTTFISTDVAAVPLLWVLPLALYLLTFVLAFSSPPRYPRALVDRGFPLLLLLLVLFLVIGVVGPLTAVVPIHLTVFFLAALLCHRQLADERPHAAHLTEFYLLLALGGVLGSLFNTLAAPILFTSILEYPIVLLLVCLLRPKSDGPHERSRAWRVVSPVVVGVATLTLVLAGAKIDSVSVRFALLGIPAFLCLSLSRTKLPFAAAIASMLVVTLFQPDPRGEILHAERTFFGIYRVNQDASGEYRTLTHGTTLHGVQSVSESGRHEPLSYYHRTGPLGDVFQVASQAPASTDVAVIGLGVGSVATYRKPAQNWTFFEIDPAVEAIARNRNYFSYLADCGEACGVIIGDARQSLTAVSAQYGVMVLDAFSSDAIPLHLVTREAIHLYLSRLAPGGLLAFHISNRHLNLEPVLARLAAEAGVAAVVRRDRVADDDRSGKTSSDWMVMARNQADLGSLTSNPKWHHTEGTSADLWTDDFSNILTLLVRQ